MCNKTPPHLGLCVGSLHCFPPSSSKSTPRNSAWSNATANSRFLPLSGRSCSAFACGESRTLAGFRRSYNATADEPISPGGFYNRLTPSLAEYLRDLVEVALDEVAVPDTVDADFDRFRDVMVADGTVLRLHRFLADAYEPRKGSRVERGSTCSTTSPIRRSTGSASPTKKHTTARSLSRVRGSKIGWYCSIKRTSSTAVSH